ncbi:MAG: hypothetical protein AAF752_00005, partial [Bacteroidota bacterium]
MPSPTANNVSEPPSRPTAQLLSRLRPWLDKGAWTVLDQALFAGANFLLNILLVQWIGEAWYGAFTVAFTVFLLAGAVHTGLLTEPMLVFGPGRYAGVFHRYLQVLLRGHALVSVALGVLVGSVGGVLWANGWPLVGPALVALALSMPFLLLLWLVRRACYVVFQIRWAAEAGAVYLVAQLLIAWGLHQAGLLNPATALAAMAGAALPAVMLMLFRINRWDEEAETEEPAQPVLGQATASELRADVLTQHWAYGRWASATGMLEWVPGYLSFLILPVAATIAASGALKALQNFIMPVVQVYAALSVLLIPVLVRARRNDTFWQTTFGMLGLMSAGTFVYWMVLGFFGEPLMLWLYQGEFMEYAGLLWWVGALPFVSAF